MWWAFRAPSGSSMPCAQRMHSVSARVAWASQQALKTPLIQPSPAWRSAAQRTESASEAPNTHLVVELAPCHTMIRPHGLHVAVARVQLGGAPCRLGARVHQLLQPAALACHPHRELAAGREQLQRTLQRGARGLASGRIRAAAALPSQHTPAAATPSRALTSVCQTLGGKAALSTAGAAPGRSKSTGPAALPSSRSPVLSSAEVPSAGRGGRRAAAQLGVHLCRAHACRQSEQRAMMRRGGPPGVCSARGTSPASLQAVAPHRGAAPVRA